MVVTDLDRDAAQKAGGEGGGLRRRVSILALVCLASIGAAGCTKAPRAIGAGHGDVPSALSKDAGPAKDVERIAARDQDGAKASRSGDGDAIRVQVIHPRPGGIKRTTTQPGSVQSFEAVALYARVSGYLSNQKVDFGDPVRQGDVLAEVYAPELRSAVVRAEAAVKKSQAMVAQAQATIAARQSDVKASEAKRDETQVNLKALQATVTLREIQYKRISELAKLKAIEQELADEAAQKLDVAKADELAGEKAVITAEVQIVTAQAALAEAQAALVDAQAGVAVNQAQLQQSRDYLGFTAIIAPFDGVITNRNYFNGDFVRTAVGGGEVPDISKPIVRVARTDKFRVVVQLPDSDVPYLHDGEDAVVTVDSLPGRMFHGKVSRSARAEKYASRTMHTEIDILNRDGILADGMYGNVTIDLQSSSKGVTIPSSCLFGKLKDERRSLFVVENGRAHERQVKIDLDTGAHAGIFDGLSANDAVIFQHGEGLRDNSRVIVTATESLESVDEQVAKEDQEKPRK